MNARRHISRALRAALVLDDQEQEQEQEQRTLGTWASNTDDHAHALAYTHRAIVDAPTTLDAYAIATAIVDAAQHALDARMSRHQIRQLDALYDTDDTEGTNR